jgi:hypothetical protein
MTTEDDIRRIALSLPETDEHPSYEGTSSFRVRKKGFSRILEDGGTITVFVEDEEEKQALLASNPKAFSTTPHYDGYPVVLVRYAEIDRDELRELLTDSWRQRAPKRLRAAFEASETSGEPPPIPA